MLVSDVAVRTVGVVEKEAVGVFLDDGWVVPSHRSGSDSSVGFGNDEPVGLVVVDAEDVGVEDDRYLCSVCELQRYFEACVVLPSVVIRRPSVLKMECPCRVVRQSAIVYHL